MAPLKVVVVVHGMGEHRRNDALLGLVRPTLELVRTRGDPSKGIVFTGNLAFDKPASVDVRYGDQVWRFMEYWWAQGFQRPGRLPVAWWIARRLVAHVASLLVGLWRSLGDLNRTDQPSQDPLVARVYQPLATLIYLVGVGLMLVLTPILALLWTVLSYLRWVPGVSPVVHLLQSPLQTIGVDYLGDVYVYLNDEVQAAQICGGLQEMLTALGEDPAVTDVILFAHSTGVGVAYEALARCHASDCPKAAKAVAKVRAFIGAGSILNMAWNLAIVRHARFRKPIPPHIRWYNLWTRYDAGPAGPIAPDDKPWLREGNFVNRRVNNSEDILFDHTGYWSNREQVLTLVLEELGGLNYSNDFWRGPGQRDPADWRSRSAQAWKDWDLRRGTAAWLAFFRLPIWLVVLGVLIPSLFFHDWADIVSGWLPIQMSIPTWVTRLQVAKEPSFTVGFVQAMAVAPLLVAALLSYLAYWLFWWRWWARRERRRRDAEFISWRNERRASANPVPSDIEPNGGNSPRFK